MTNPQCRLTHNPCTVPIAVESGYWKSFTNKFPKDFETAENQACKSGLSLPEFAPFKLLQPNICMYAHVPGPGQDTMLGRDSHGEIYVIVKS